MGLVETLRGENRRLAAESEPGHQNIELVFRSGIEQSLGQAREHLEESGREGARVRAEMQVLTRPTWAAPWRFQPAALQDQGRVAELEGLLRSLARLDDQSLVRPISRTDPAPE